MDYRQPPPGSPYLVTAFASHVVCVEAATGRELWRTQLPADYVGYGIRLHVDEHEVVALAATEVRALALSTGVERLRVPLGEVPQGAPTLLVQGRRAYVSSMGVLSCVDLDRGAVLWRNELEGTGYGPAALAVAGSVVQGDAR